jgi:hypothetical protein
MQRAVWLLAAASIACGKSKDIGDGVDMSGGRGGDAGHVESGDGGDDGTSGNAGTGGRSVNGSGGASTMGQAGELGAPASGGTGGLTMGNFGARSAGGATGKISTMCSIPNTIELVESSELGSSSWAPEDQCDAAAESVRTTSAADDDATLDVKPLAGKWVDGSGAERVELVFDETGRGTVLFGEPIDLPEVDPDEPYLTEIGATDAEGFDQFSYKPTLVSGFAYSVIPAQGRASEMSFAIRGSEPWSVWCAEQEPVHGVDCYACEFRGDTAQYAGAECGERAGCYVGLSSEPGRYVPTHCGRLALCAGVSRKCWCTKDTCMNDPSRTHSYKVTIDPVDVAVLRFNEEYATEGTRYLTREP